MRSYNAKVTFSQKQRVLLVFVPPLAALLVRLLGSTLRFAEVMEPGARPANQHPSDPGVYVFWHRALLLAAYRYRNLGIHILISSSFDGELIARVVERLGFVAVRGSSSRGGAAGLLALTRARQTGAKVAITADGPRGPMYLAKGGAAAIAQHAEAEASCFHLHTERAWTLRSWDRFVIPKPFSYVRTGWCAPVPVARTWSPAESTACIQEALDRAVRLAENR